MSHLLAARSQIAVSLGFHIIFSVIGIALPLLMTLAEALYLIKKDAVYLSLAKHWAKGAGILFAVGAVSGTVLSFELGLLWPTFMQFAGPIIGMPFSLEGFAFFMEAIFLGIYLYGWNKIRPTLHLITGCAVTLCGSVSTVFIVSANGWMNSPTGFTLAEDGSVRSIDPFAAMVNPAAFTEITHMLLAAFMAVSFAVMGIHAWMLIKNAYSSFHQKALTIALVIAAIATPLTILSGDRSAKHVAKHQPIKLAAMESLWETTTDAPLKIGGLPNEQLETTPYAIDIPYLLSFLAYSNIHATVKGLKAFPKEDWPPILPVHIAFQIMVACGSFQLFILLLIGYFKLRKRRIFNIRWLLQLLIFSSPLGFIAIEAGWTVTEVGRQPWVIYGLMRTSEAVTPMPHLNITLGLFTCLYIFLGAVVVHLLKRQFLLTVFPSKQENSHHVSN